MQHIITTFEQRLLRCSHSNSLNVSLIFEADLRGRERTLLLLVESSVERPARNLIDTKKFMITNQSLGRFTLQAVTVNPIRSGKEKNMRQYPFPSSEMPSGE